METRKNNKFNFFQKQKKERLRNDKMTKNIHIKLVGPWFASKITIIIIIESSSYFVTLYFIGCFTAYQCSHIYYSKRMPN